MSRASLQRRAAEFISAVCWRHCQRATSVPARALLAAALCLAAALGTAACSRHDRRLEQHQRALQSLGATTHAIAGAWLGGNASGTYTRTALEQTLLLLEQERAALAGRPAMLLDPRGAQLADTADLMARLIALIVNDVRAADADGARRRHLATLPKYNERVAQ